jgi:predicted Zn-dependent peptidase
MSVCRKELKNGLIVATENMAHLRSVSIGVWVRGGSRYESADTPGISHFIEHLLFKGTRTRSASDIAKAIDSIGGQLNAFTDKEYVGFYAKVLDTHLPFAFELLSDIVLNPSFPPQEIERERNVIFEEINMVEDTPHELIQDLFMESFWRNHPLGRPISGSKESVARITRSQVRAFFKEKYTASNTIISVAGNIRHKAVHNLAEKYFSSLERGTPVESGSVPLASAERSVTSKAHLEQTHLCIGAPCPPMNSKHRYGTHILSSVLGGGMSSRLFQNIREKRGLVYTIYSMPNEYHDTGAMVIYAGASPDKANEVVDLTLKELRRLRERLIPPAELERARENIKGSIMLSLESSSSRMTNLAQQLIYFGRFYSFKEIMGGFDRVRAEDLRDLAYEMFHPATLAITALASDQRGRLKTALKEK